MRLAGSLARVYQCTVAVVVLFAYNALNVLVQYCKSSAVSADSSTLDLELFMPTSVSPLRNSTDLDAIHRPPLDGSLSLHNMEQEWAQRHYAQCSADQSRPCPFAWIALRKEREHQHLDSVDSILVQATGWKYDTTWPPTNYGLYGSRNGTAILRVENATYVSSITIVYHEELLGEMVQQCSSGCGFALR